MFCSVSSSFNCKMLLQMHSSFRKFLPDCVMFSCLKSCSGGAQLLLPLYGLGWAGLGLVQPDYTDLAGLGILG